MSRRDDHPDCLPYQPASAGGDLDGIPFEPSPAERADMIAVAAYYLAEQRAFAPGGEEADWLLAEEQIDRMISRARAAELDHSAFHRLGLRNALRLWGN
jgi:hypothetical protein